MNLLSMTSFSDLNIEVLTPPYQPNGFCFPPKISYRVLKSPAFFLNLGILPTSEFPILKPMDSALIRLDCRQT